MNTFPMRLIPFNQTIDLDFGVEGSHSFNVEILLRTEVVEVSMDIPLVVVGRKVVQMVDLSSEVCVVLGQGIPLKVLHTDPQYFEI